MNLKDLMTKLSYNELASQSISLYASGNIKPEAQGRIVTLVNDALTELFTRFVVLEKELVIKSIDYLSKYPLRKEHAVSNTASTQTKFILDTPNDPFIGDLINVLTVCNEVGNELPINDAEQYASVFLPQADVLQLTHVGYSQAFFITYKAKHPELTYDPNDIDTSLAQEIQIPVCLEAPLRIRVAASVYSAMSGQDSTAKSSELMQLFEKACTVLEEQGLLSNTALGTNVKLHRRGFI